MGGTYNPSSLNIMLLLNQNPFVNTQLLLLATLKFPNLSKLTNDPILHHLAWLPIPVKIPINIMKFKDKIGDDPSSHITTYHLCCVSNSMLETWMIQSSCISSPVL